MSGQFCCSTNWRPNLYLKKRRLEDNLFGAYELGKLNCLKDIKSPPPLVFQRSYNRFFLDMLISCFLTIPINSKHFLGMKNKLSLVKILSSRVPQGTWWILTKSSTSLDPPELYGLGLKDITIFFFPSSIYGSKTFFANNVWRSRGKSSESTAVDRKKYIRNSERREKV